MQFSYFLHQSVVRIQQNWQGRQCFFPRQTNFYIYRDTPGSKNVYYENHVFCFCWRCLGSFVFHMKHSAIQKTAAERIVQKILSAADLSRRLNRPNMLFSLHHFPIALQRYRSARCGLSPAHNLCPKWTTPAWRSALPTAL